jgi:hypothetical protein
MLVRDTLTRIWPGPTSGRETFLISKGFPGASNRAIRPVYTADEFLSVACGRMNGANAVVGAYALMNSVSVVRDSLSHLLCGQVKPRRCRLDALFPPSGHRPRAGLVRDDRRPGVRGDSDVSVISTPIRNTAFKRRKSPSSAQ